MATRSNCLEIWPEKPYWNELGQLVTRTKGCTPHNESLEDTYVCREKFFFLINGS